MQQLNGAAEAVTARKASDEPPSCSRPHAGRAVARGAATSPLVGEGRGGGAGKLARKSPTGATPTPDPSAQGGGEESAAASNLNSAPKSGGQRVERIPLGIACMLAATILFAGSSALSKWLVATYPIGEMLFMRAATALIGVSLVILPVTGFKVFRTKRLRDHLLRSVSQSCAQTFLVIAFSLMPLASAVAINFSAPLFATVAAFVFLKETVGPVRWGALIVGFMGVLLVTSPGADTLQAGSLFALANAVLFGTVTVGVRRMTATESAETLTMYQMVFLTAFFAAALPFGWVTPTLADWGALAANGLANALGQYLWTRALHLAPTSAVVPFNYFSLVWAIILGLLVWGDVPSATLLVGSAVVVGSGMFLLWHESRGR
ncbi:MAG TPA: DMT family transporter [Xanthobacteraceae bacterium]|nr:DMT family transporter [Xanthobacteraceae bacterium]